MELGTEMGHTRTHTTRRMEGKLLTGKGRGRGRELRKSKGILLGTGKWEQMGLGKNFRRQHSWGRGEGEGIGGLQGFHHQTLSLINSLPWDSLDCSQTYDLFERAQRLTRNSLFKIQYSYLIITFLIQFTTILNTGRHRARCFWFRLIINMNLVNFLFFNIINCIFS